MLAKDIRMRALDEMMSGIKSIKYNSMENIFSDRIKLKRDSEMGKLLI